MITRKRQMNNIVPPPKLCKLIPAGEFKKSVLVWELIIFEKLDFEGNVIERNKMLALTPRDATIRKPKVPKTAKQRLDLLEFYDCEDRTISYIEAIYPAPTLQEILVRFHITTLKGTITKLDGTHHKTGEVANSIGGVLIGEWVTNEPVPTNATAALKLWLKLTGVEA